MLDKTQSICRHRHSESGLSLIEVCILLVVFSLLLIPALQVMSLERKAAEIDKHNGTPIELANALTNYALENGAYPIPAAPRLPLTNAKVFSPAVGAEIPTVCSMTGAEGITTGAGLINNFNGLICRPKYSWDTSGYVYVGTLPVSVLGLPPEKGLDENGNKFTYMVTRALTVAPFNDAGGIITIRDTNNGVVKVGSTAITNAHFVIISHGKNGAGGWRANGELIPTGFSTGNATALGAGHACPGRVQAELNLAGGRAEFGNQYQCKLNGGGGYVAYARAMFKTVTDRMRGTSEGAGDTFYDDSVEYATSVYGRLWTPRDNGYQYFSYSGNIGIGAKDPTTAVPSPASPTQKLSLLAGNVLVSPDAPASKATIKSPKLCNVAGTSCFKPGDIDAPIGSGPLYCASGVGLKKVNYVTATTSAQGVCDGTGGTNPIRNTPFIPSDPTKLIPCPLGIKKIEKTTGAITCAN